MLNTGDLFSGAFGNKSRLKILMALSTKSLSVNELSSITGLEQTNVSHNLKFLKNNNIIIGTVNGRYHMYRIREEYELLVGDVVRNVKKHRKLIEKVGVITLVAMCLLRPSGLSDPQLLFLAPQYSNLFGMLGGII